VLSDADGLIPYPLAAASHTDTVVIARAIAEGLAERADVAGWVFMMDAGPLGLAATSNLPLRPVA
jgi:hypothetical protein